MAKKELLTESGGSAFYISSDMEKVVLKNYRDSIVLSLVGFERLLRILKTNENFRDNFVEIAYRHMPESYVYLQPNFYNSLMNLDGVHVCRSINSRNVVFMDSYDKQVSVTLDFLDSLESRIEEYKENKLNRESN